MVTVLHVRKRGCGWPKEGGVYMVSDDGSSNGVLARIVKIDPPIPMLRKPHRGPILVDGNVVLSRAPEDSWVVGSSAKTVERNRADEVWRDMFGMPLAKRLMVGDCYGLTSADEAYEHLLNTVDFNKQALNYLRQLALEDIQNLPNAAVNYANIVSHLQQYVLSRGTEPVHLVRAAGACWELFYAVPNRKRTKLAAVAYLLSSIGLVKDGRQMLMAINPE